MTRLELMGFISLIVFAYACGCILVAYLIHKILKYKKAMRAMAKKRLNKELFVGTIDDHNNKKED